MAFKLLAKKKLQKAVNYKNIIISLHDIHCFYQSCGLKGKNQCKPRPMRINGNNQSSCGCKK